MSIKYLFCVKVVLLDYFDISVVIMMFSSFWICCILLMSFHISDEFVMYRFKRIYCSSSGIYVKVLFCYVKSYPKRISTMNIGIEVVKTSNDLKVSLFVCFNS